MKSIVVRFKTIYAIASRQKSLSSGFTIIELLVVLAIISILALGMMTVVNPLEQLAKSRDAKIKSDLATIQKALEVYYADNNSYPSSADGKILDNLGERIEWGSSKFQPYLQELPKDDSPGRNYVYQSTGQSYWLYASLHRGGKDPAACNAPMDTVCLNASGLSCGNGVCNYGVSSPNTSP